MWHKNVEINLGTEHDDWGPGKPQVIVLEDEAHPSLPYEALTCWINGILEAT